jgi:subtilisin family serine protease
MTSGQILNISALTTGSTSATINAPANKPSVVVTVSAGNSGMPTLNMSEIAALYNSAYNQNLIIVGALGANGSIASYSSTAGGAADRFVVIDGTGTGSPYSGTSYSAPRIAGYAAIIKQKYPNATGEQIASAILNTAVLQPGWDAATYGRGKADLNAALNYLGTAK